MPGFYLPEDDEFDHHEDDFMAPYRLSVKSKLRKYRHFDLPLKDSERIQKFDFSSKVSPHRFLPLLGFTDRTRKFSSSSGVNKVQKIKDRPIRFAGHKDAFYLQAYASHLNKYYEQSILTDNLSNSVLAYRSGGGTNIHHAKSLFDEIKYRKNCTVIAYDISGFFDNIDHYILREELLKILNARFLNNSHANVWKNITKYSWVETEDLDRILGKKRDKNGRICSEADFRKYVRGRSSGLIRTNDTGYGIPQGTPISGLYANIYLKSFDQDMRGFCEQYGGSYRRYSDDIALVLPTCVKLPHITCIVEKLLADVCLTLSSNKTEFAIFRDGILTTQRPIQYLGFTFDGNEVLIRPSSIAAYLRKMRRGIHAKMVAAKMGKVPTSKIFKREALSRYTRLGKRRNFIRYAYKSSEIMKSKSIRKQIKKHNTWFKRVWEQEKIRVF
ncbi:antiviral reverse transcriptase Drt2 [Gluconobacter cerinus]|uniref:antiviral reverse transcriptase Drt2 n=1 Tax=Gluconobacter cerinus TaxID=38307 RepID=UPI001B8BA9AA|nr:antiviral reverse transcriptase Drt2 [Gluconobacter cerinus]MBS0984124.1 hypothetical protein [Gluconobacter cerinus]